MIPRMCDAAALPGQTNQCGTDPYILLADKAECVDQQTLKMQVQRCGRLGGKLALEGAEAGILGISTV